MADEYFLEHVCYVVGIGEGAIQGGQVIYDLIEIGLKRGISILQWTDSRSYGLLKDIYDVIGWGGTNPPDDIRIPIENNTPWDYFVWGDNEPRTLWVREYLVLEESKKIQSTKFLADVQGYIDYCRSRGITDLKAIAYMSDIVNQYGPGWGTNWGGERYDPNLHNNLVDMHNFTDQEYGPRRKDAFEYLRDLPNFDSPPPVRLNFETDTFEPPAPPTPEPTGNQELPTPPLNRPSVQVEIQNAHGHAFVYPSGLEHHNAHYRIFKGVAGTLYINPVVVLPSDLDNEIVEEVIREVEEREVEQTTNRFEETVEEIPEPAPTAIDIVVNKARSYPLNTIPYSMSPPRDMVVSGDCSSYVDICFREVGVQIGGWTGAQYQVFKTAGCIIMEGGRDLIDAMTAQAKKGDVVLMSQDSPTYSSQGWSHVVLMTDYNEMLHQSSYDRVTQQYNIGPSLDHLDGYLYSIPSFSYICLARPIPN